MKLKNFLIFFLLTCNVGLYSQVHILQLREDVTSIEIGKELVIYDGRIYGVVASLCGQEQNECMIIFCSDIETNIIWSKELPWTDVGNNNTLLVRNDSIIVSSHNAWSFQDWKYYVSIFSTHGDSLKSITYDLNNDVYAGLANEGIVELTNSFVLFGSVGVTDDTTGGVIVKSTKDGILESKLYYSSSNNFNHFSEFGVTTDNVIYGLLRTRDQSVLTKKREIVSIDTNLNLSSVWESEMNTVIDKISDILLVLQNDDLIVMDVVDDFANGDPEVLRCIDKVGNEKWYYQWPNIDITQFWEFSIRNIIDSGDGIIGCGYYSAFDENKQLWRTFPYLFRLDYNGNLLWEHFYTIRNGDGFEFDFATLRDVETEDGNSIVSIGSVIPSDGYDKVLIIKVDENGCFVDSMNDCDEFEVSITTSILEEEITSDLKIYPNPTSETCKIEFTGHYFFSSLFSLYDINSNLVLSENITNNSQEIDLTGYVSGVYFYTISEKRSSKILAKGKLLKVESF